MFQSDNLQDLIAFKWDQYGFKFHLIGTTVHMIYLGFLFIYTLRQYVYPDPKDSDHTMSLIILFCVTYPLLYEFTQVCNLGPFEYFSDMGNWFDIVFIGGSIVMTILHYFNGPLEFYSRLVMAIVLLSANRRTMTFLRIFKSLSTIVTMLSTVIFQLRIFLTFFFILCILLSLMFSVLGVGNYIIPGDFRDAFYDEKDGWSRDAPNAEYRMIGLFAGSIVQTFRLAMGDFAIIGSSMYIKDPNESILFWILWFITVLLGCVIFLNFIVAEASETYNEVSEYIEEYIQ